MAVSFKGSPCPQDTMLMSMRCSTVLGGGWETIAPPSEEQQTPAAVGH